MAAGGTPTQVKVGPGRLWIAPVGSTEPTTLTADPAVAWVPIGYTVEGSTFNATMSTEGVDVAEEIDMIRYEQTAREMNVEFAMAQLTAENLDTAFNGGTLTTSGSGAAQVVTFEPPEAGDVTRCALLWQSDDETERWVFRKCVQGGDISIARQKAPNKATIPVSFRLEKPDGLLPFKAIFADPA